MTSLVEEDVSLGEKAATSEYSSASSEVGAMDGEASSTSESSSINSCNCFTAGTKVETDSGEKSIEDIQVGDKVLSKDEVTGEEAYKEVTATFQHETDEIYKIHVGDQTIEVTYNHPFWVEGKGWTYVKDLKVGDLLVQSNGNKIKIDSIELEKKHITVYNMTVADFHTYFVSDLGLWVHNTNCKVSRRQAFREAKEAAGIPKSAQYEKHGFVYDGTTENRTVYQFTVDGEKKYIVQHEEDQFGRGPHFHGADDTKGDPFNKGRYNQYDGHFPEDFNGFSK